MLNHTRPSLVVVDDFYTDPGEVLGQAERASYVEDERYYKGKRSDRHLFPYVRERFQLLLGAHITDWTQQPYNGCFQVTTERDPLVWHSDHQDYAGAVYLRASGVDEGTSFWRDRKYGNRRPPTDEQECIDVYSPYNLTHPDNWELVDRIGSVENRLVLWDAKMIHSATAYKSDRIVQLFFFSVQ